MKRTERMKSSGLVLSCAMLSGIGAAQAETAGPVVCGGPDASCYQVYLYDTESDAEAEIGWEAARTAANEKLNDGVTGRLATITSAEEDEFIRQFAVSSFTATGLPAAELWVGGFQSPQGDEPGAVEPDGNWQWINGEGLFLYTNWDSGEPNDIDGEEHLGIGRQGFGEVSYGWNDEAFLGNIGGYVVEFGAWFPAENAVVFPPSPETQITAVAQEVVEAGTFQQFSCMLTQPVHLIAATNLVKEIRNTPGCEELAARLPDTYKASLLPLSAGVRDHRRRERYGVRQHGDPRNREASEARGSIRGDARPHARPARPACRPHERRHPVAGRSRQPVAGGTDLRHCIRQQFADDGRRHALGPRPRAASLPETSPRPAIARAAPCVTPTTCSRTRSATCRRYRRQACRSCRKAWICARRSVAKSAPAA